MTTATRTLDVTASEYGVSFSLPEQSINDVNQHLRNIDQAISRITPFQSEKHPYNHLYDSRPVGKNAEYGWFTCYWSPQKTLVVSYEARSEPCRPLALPIDAIRAAQIYSALDGCLNPDNVNIKKV